MLGDFSSPLRDEMISRSFYVSPESSSSKSENPAFVSELESPPKSGDSYYAMTSPGALPSFSSSSIALFDEDGDLQINVDHVAELLARSRGSGSAAQSAALSLFNDDLSTDHVESLSFKLTSAVTSPSNRVRNKIITDDTPKIANGFHQLAQSEAPNFSVVVSPVAKQEDHTVNVEGDWSFDANKSASVDSSEAKSALGSNFVFKPEPEWVVFEPFEEFTGPTRAEHSFTPYDPEVSENVSSNDNYRTDTATNQLLEELNGRLKTVEGILRSIQYNGQHGSFDERSMAFVIDESMSDDRTCTPVKTRVSGIESTSALFRQFFGKKTTLYEV
jgi:hypothetical protein